MPLTDVGYQEPLSVQQDWRLCLCMPRGHFRLLVLDTACQCKPDSCAAPVVDWCGTGICWGAQFQLVRLHHSHDFQPYLWLQSRLVQKVGPMPAWCLLQTTA